MKHKKTSTVLLMIILLLSLPLSVNAKTPPKPVYDLTTIQEWLTVEIWNDGLCDFDWYMELGTDACGDSLDSAFALEKFKINALKIVEYDAYISSLPDPQFTTLKSDWVYLKNEIVKQYGILLPYSSLPIDEKGLDLGLYEQYEDAFKDDLAAMGY